MPIAIASPDGLALLESQLTALRRAIAELDRMLAHVPAEPAHGWRGPARDAYAVVLARLRRNLIEVRSCLTQAQATTAAALNAAALGAAALNAAALNAAALNTAALAAGGGS